MLERKQEYEYRHLAYLFKDKKIEPFYVTVEPSDIYIVRLPGGGYTPPAFPKQSVYALDRDATAELLNAHFRDPDMPVAAEKLEIPTDVEWPYGVTSDPGKTLGDVNDGSQ